MEGRSVQTPDPVSLCLLTTINIADVIVPETGSGAKPNQSLYYPASAQLLARRLMWCSRRPSGVGA
jgi:hypothetical protein